MILPTPQDDKDYKAFVAELEEQLRVETITTRESVQEEREESDLLLPEVIEVSRKEENNSSPILLPISIRKTLQDKGKENKKARSSSKRKVRFEEEEKDEASVRRSRRISKKTKKAKGAKTTL